MGLFDGLRGEFVDIIEWTDNSRDTFVWRFPRHDNEIKMGARLIVRESQSAVFVNEGQLADVFGPGTYTLETQNLPMLTTLKNWRHGFDSPFKAEVYFVNTRQFTDFKWGTKNPVLVRDSEFGAVRIRAFGAYSVRVTDPAKLLRESAGTDARFRTDEIEGWMREKVVAAFAPAIASAGIPVLDMAIHQDSIGERLRGAVAGQLAPLGLDVPSFTISNISMPKEVEEAIDKRTSMGVVGDLGSYTQFQAANALEESAKHGGGASDALGMGAGMAMGQQMAANMAASQQAPQQQQAAPAGPPPLPVTAEWYLGLGGQQVGPLDTAALQGKIASGELTRETLAWKQGQAAWTPAGQIPDLANLFGAVPPPLPPQ
ncbi:SPFH domain-containing protein [Glycomyces buryatensis]|uniref:SPFH domain-containing protein n=1 Tax=Glycomyces buryatensis TaxID=2570927 RepID=A0A4S8Q6Z9_9ACTN|nr:SPFH domain-containing protein [Glycomyces buryatensis]THV40083.1 SPFH domain-containing protein [Glycomyces buryatensis]